MSMNKKLTANVARKAKKLKKTESMARQQHQSKSELTTAQGARPAQADSNDDMSNENSHSAYLTNPNG